MSIFWTITDVTCWQNNCGLLRPNLQNCWFGLFLFCVCVCVCVCACVHVCVRVLTFSGYLLVLMMFVTVCR